MKESLKILYNQLIRPHIPHKIGVYNGVAVRRPKLFDITDHFPDQKRVLSNAAIREIRFGDSVIEVGGGWGLHKLSIPWGLKGM